MNQVEAAHGAYFLAWAEGVIRTVPLWASTSEGSAQLARLITDLRPEGYWNSLPEHAAAQRDGLRWALIRRWERLSGEEWLYPDDKPDAGLDDALASILGDTQIESGEGDVA